MTARKSERQIICLHIKPVSAAVAVALGTISTPLYAVEQNVEREEIIVTATRRDTTAQEVPINITAVSGEQLKEYQITNLAEFSRWIPGLTLVDQGPRNGSPIIIRGLNIDELDASEISVGNGGGGTVSTYYGEVPIYIDLKLVDMERVEVLRGPQGTLYGANSLAGSIRYIPKAPDTENFSSDIYGNTFATEHSDDPSYDVGVTLNAPLISNKLAFRGTLAYEDRAGFIDYNYLVREPGVSDPEPDFGDPADVSANLRSEKDVNDAQTTVARLALLWDITDSVDATLSYHYQKLEVGGRQLNNRAAMSQMDVNGSPLDTGNYVSGYRVKEPIERENEIFELDVVADLGFAELTSATGYTTYDETGNRDQTDILLDLSYYFGPSYGATYTEFPSFVAYTEDTQDQTRFTQEFRLVSPADGGRINWIAGAFYRDQDFKETSVELTPNYPTWLEPVVNDFKEAWPDTTFPDGYELEYAARGRDEIEEFALFGEIGMQLTDRWQATLGARYFDIENTFTSEFSTPILDVYLSGLDEDFNPIEPLPVEEAVQVSSNSDSTSWDDVIFKFNTAFAFTDDQMGYLTVSEGFREGGFTLLPPCDPVPLGVCGTPEQQRYEPDTTTNYELGYKSTWLEEALIFNAAIYYIDWQDPQLTGFSEGGQIPITINGEGAETKGIELEASWWITDQLAIRAAYSYTDATLSEDGPEPWEDGDRLPGSPENQGSLGVRYLQPLSNGWDLLFDYGLTSQSDVFTRLGNGDECCRDGGFDYPPGEVLPGFTLHFASISLAGDSWTAALYAENLTDKYAVTGVRKTTDAIKRTGFGEDFAMRRYANYMVTPRTIGLDLRFRFD